MEHETRTLLEFTSDGNTCFRIRVINRFVSGIALGMYIACAKVRG